jgi:hypothetical protein
MRRATTLLLILLTLAMSSTAQITGLWQVDKVTVGEETMTPVAKWFLLTADMKTRSGNGGVENSKGTYIFDYVKSEVLFSNENGQQDPYGPFRVKMDDDKMMWTRVEEGAEVTVHLTRTNDKPEAPWDKIIGNWILTEKSSGEVGESQSIFMRWDRRYVARNGIFGENRFGVWHIHGHKPELRLISDQGDDNDSAWDISFEGDSMIWVERDTDTPIRLTYLKGD